MQEIKEKLCYVAMEPAKDRALALDTTVLVVSRKWRGNAATPTK